MANLDQLASQASSLLSNDAFTKALHDIREDARDGLCRTPATDIEAIRDHQATARVVDDILTRLRSTSKSGTPQQKPGIA